MTLHDYRTGDVIREATAEELTASIEAARHDGGAGVIRVDGRDAYAVGDEATDAATRNYRIDEAGTSASTHDSLNAILAWYREEGYPDDTVFLVRDSAGERYIDLAGDVIPRARIGRQEDVTITAAEEVVE